MTDRELMSKAKQASLNAYVPYSRFAVGAAIECTDGTVFTGCNVENAALGSTICAERTACARRSARVTGTSGASPSMPTAKTGVPPWAHAASFWRSFHRRWRCSAPRPVTAM